MQQGGVENTIIGATMRPPKEHACVERERLLSYATPRACVSVGVLVTVLACVATNVPVGAVVLVAGGAVAGLVGLLSRVPETALLAALALRPILSTLPRFSVFGRDFGIEGLANLMLVAGLVAALPRRFCGRLLRDPIVLWMGLLLGLCLLSLPRSTDLVFGARQWLRFASYLLFFLIAGTANRAKAGALVGRAFGGMVVVLLLAGAIQLAWLSSYMPFRDYVGGMLDNSPDLLAQRLTGFLDYPHSYARLLLIAVCVFLTLGETAEAGYRWPCYIGVLACLGAMVFTGVRSVLLATGIAMLVVTWGSRRPLRLAGVGVAFLAIGFGSGVFQARLNEFVDSRRTLEWNPLVDRREIWSVVDRAIAEHPWRGYGLGSIEAYVGASPLRSSTPQEIAAHCDYRKFAFEAGIPAGVLLAMAFAAVAWRGWRRRVLSGTSGALSLAAAGSAVGLMLVGSVDALMQDYVSMGAFWTLAGAALGPGSRVPDGLSETKEGAACPA